MIKSICLLIVLFACCSATAYCWQWGKTGRNLSGAFSNESAMAADPAGNVYIVTIDSNISVDGHRKAGFGPRNMCIVSFDCSGKYRWSKIIGTAYLSGNLKISTDNNKILYPDPTITHILPSTKGKSWLFLNRSIPIKEMLFLFII